jgi:hypothetical protein
LLRNRSIFKKFVLSEDVIDSKLITTNSKLGSHVKDLATYPQEEWNGVILLLRLGMPTIILMFTYRFSNKLNNKQ